MRTDARRSRGAPPLPGIDIERIGDIAPSPGISAGPSSPIDDAVERRADGEASLEGEARRSVRFS